MWLIAVRYLDTKAIELVRPMNLVLGITRVSAETGVGVLAQYEVMDSIHPRESQQSLPVTRLLDLMPYS